MGYINLHKKSFFNNLDYFSTICTKEKLAIALKDNAYGHGTYEIASMCKEYGIQHVFVKNMREAKLIEEFLFDTILVLYDIPKIKYDNIITSINSIEDLSKVPKGSKIELKIDTGMNRNGILHSQIDLAVESILRNDLILFGVFTHFCCADEDDNSITNQQEKKFENSVAKIKSLIKNDFRIHCANSHGVFKVDMKKYDLARIGIGAYGYLDFEQTKHLAPVLSLYAKKITTKKIKKDQHVGYGSDAFIASKNMIVSNYDIGYADGFLRLSEIKKAKVSNEKEILGRVSMDSFSIEGDDKIVCVFNNANKLAKAHNTINYEILASLSPFLKRTII
ncbi:MAG: alanine racemase [Campylobacterota bacterium]|nr:alanine racemase [Campylobacterota bacterium]